MHVDIDLVRICCVHDQIPILITDSMCQYVVWYGECVVALANPHYSGDIKIG
jgi:hypothetical protein